MNILYIKGDINHPIITQVIGIYSEYKRYTTNCLTEVIENETRHYDSFRIVKDYAGNEIFIRYTPQDYPSYNELQKGRFGSESSEDSRGKQDGRRSIESDSESGIKLSLQETAAAGEKREQLIRENDNLRVANTLLKKELQLTQGKMISFDNAKDIAKYLTTEYSADYEKPHRFLKICAVLFIL